MFCVNNVNDVNNNALQQSQNYSNLKPSAIFTFESYYGKNASNVYSAQGCAVYEDAHHVFQFACLGFLFFPC